MSATFTATVVTYLAATVETLTNAIVGPTYLDGPLGGVASMVAVALAAVFVTAAVTKFMSPADTVSEFRQLLVPAPRLMAKLVPTLELLAAASLVLFPRLGAILAATMLGAFTTLLVVTVRSGRTVSCGCLGSVSTKPVTMATVARNFFFLAMAAVALTIPSLTVPDLASLLLAGSLVLLLALSAQLVALRQTLGRIWSVQLAGETSASGQSNTTTTDTKGMAA